MEALYAGRLSSAYVGCSDGGTGAASVFTARKMIRGQQPRAGRRSRP